MCFLVMEVETRLAQCSKDIADTRQSGFIRVASYDRTGPFLREVEHVLQNIAYLKRLARTGDRQADSILAYIAKASMMCDTSQPSRPPSDAQRPHSPTRRARPRKQRNTIWKT